MAKWILNFLRLSGSLFKLFHQEDTCAIWEVLNHRFMSNFFRNAYRKVQAITIIDDWIRFINVSLDNYQVLTPNTVKKFPEVIHGVKLYEKRHQSWTVVKIYFHPWKQSEYDEDEYTGNQGAGVESDAQSEPYTRGRPETRSGCKALNLISTCKLNSRAIIPMMECPPPWRCRVPSAS